MTTPSIHPKNQLQEYFQRRNFKLPTYETVRAGGSDTIPIYRSTCICTFYSEEPTSVSDMKNLTVAFQATEKNKKSSETAAALKAISYIDSLEYGGSIPSTSAFPREPPISIPHHPVAPPTSSFIPPPTITTLPNIFHSTLPTTLPSTTSTFPAAIPSTLPSSFSTTPLLDFQEWFVTKYNNKIKNKLCIIAITDHPICSVEIPIITALQNLDISFNYVIYSYDNSEYSQLASYITPPNVVDISFEICLASVRAKVRRSECEITMVIPPNPIVEQFIKREPGLKTSQFLDHFIV